MSASDVMIAEARFVVGFYKRDIDTTLAALDKLRALIRQNEELEVRVFNLMNNKFDVLKGNATFEQLQENHQFMKEVLNRGNFEHKQFFDVYYGNLIVLRQGVKPDALSDILTVDSLCPPLMRGPYLLAVVALSGFDNNLDPIERLMVLERSITEYDTLKGACNG